MALKGIAYIGLGSNTGDRKEVLQEALRMLGQIAGAAVISVSSLYETAPVGRINQGPFLNAVCGLETEQSALFLLSCLNVIETRLGRVRKIKWGPRTIDLDLLLFGRQVIMNETLALPHPELVRRAFVLVPLLEIAPQELHPVTGKTVREMWDEAVDEIKRQKVTLFEKAGWHV